MTKLNLNALKPILVGAVLLLIDLSAQAADTPPSGICDNTNLLQAVRVINDACTDQFCDPQKLGELENVERSDLLRALRDPYLMPVHIFYPSGKSRLDDAFDWATTKEDQLRTISNLANPDETIIFIIGYASMTGDEGRNVRLSRDRMYAVYFYLTKVLRVKCKAIKGAWVGETILQLQESDSQLLGLIPRDYREDPLVLNQAVHVFIYPCATRM